MKFPFEQQITFVFVSDLKRSLAFYTDQIGLNLVLQQPGCCILQASRDGFIGICEREPDEGRPLILTFVHPELDRLYEELSDAGVSCDGPPRYNARYDIVQFFATDPDDYTLEFQRFCSPDWPTPS